MEATTARVSAHTADEINERIRRESESRVSDLAENPGRIDARLEELDREWDIERTLEANAASLAFAGVAPGPWGARSGFSFPRWSADSSSSMQLRAGARRFRSCGGSVSAPLRR